MLGVYNWDVKLTHRVVEICFFSFTLHSAHCMANQREPDNVVLSHSVPIKTRPMPKFLRILDCVFSGSAWTRLVLSDGTQRRAFSRYQRKLKY